MHLKLRAAIATAIFAAFSVSAVAADLKTYPSEAEATKMCRSPVVWLNTESGIYHMKGTKNYGTTKDGVWACKAAADKSGAKASRNGQ